MIETNGKILAGLAKRRSLYQSNPSCACRLFNGFYEEMPEISLDLFARTLVIQYYGKTENPDPEFFDSIISEVQSEIPDLQCVLLKSRFASDLEQRKGSLLTGKEPDSLIKEWGISYLINLRLNQDTGFYLDSALLRKWLINNCMGKKVLNTFAYTGSLSVAALIGGAAEVVQTDNNAGFLSQTRNSMGANYLDDDRLKDICGDFFHVISDMRRENRLFDLIILDPPVYSKTRGGTIDIQKNYPSLINKVRPLVADGGKIIAMNNAVYLSGADFISQLNQTFRDGYVQSGDAIPVPSSFYGNVAVNEKLPADPAPFNHSTKILQLEITRKDGQKAG